MTPELDDRLDVRRTSLRVLITVHGHETRGWGEATARAVSCGSSPIVRVLALLDVPSPPRTSPIPPARAAYDATRSAWRREEEQRLQTPLHERLLRRLTCRVLITPPPAPVGPRPARVVPIVRAVPAHRKA